MATTEQRSGFRLMWAPDARPGASATDSAQAAPETPPGDDEPTITVPPTPEATTMTDTTTMPTDLDGAALTAGPADESVPEPAPATPQPPAWQPAAAPSTRPRRDNVLVAGLVRAMRDAATAARQETAARFAEHAKARIEAIHAQSADEATELRKDADAAIVEIREWSKAEMARIREETDQRITNRRRRLESEVEAHAASVEARIERVQSAVGEFERRMDAFFEQLLAEEDPARLAGLAEQLPEAPSLEMDDFDDYTSAFPVAALDARGAAAAEAEASAALEGAQVYDDGTGEPGPDEEVEEIPEEDVVRRLETFTGPGTGQPEAAVSRLAVVGLVSVASIAGFKRALAKAAGVRSVAVASGPAGDFVFTVAHDPDMDISAAVPALEGFEAVVTGDADGVLTVTAKDPENAK